MTTLPPQRTGCAGLSPPSHRVRGEVGGSGPPAEGGAMMKAGPTGALWKQETQTFAVHGCRGATLQEDCPPAWVLGQGPCGEWRSALC